MSDWISVEDRLPKMLERVLIFDNDGFGVLSGRRGSTCWYLEGGKDEYVKVTHWMQLPEPPQ